ncbi:hypothetical protein ABVG11_18105 [Streptomyces sp. HD1123-B1]|uniref:hypothetical protein n=1 Tax=Streptomyces huangiella TaxID=3228804 RepID=UPI003D7CB79F
MEQSTGPIIPPMHTAAGTDPGYIPGLTSPRPVDGEEETPKDTAERPPADTAPEDTGPDTGDEDTAAGAGAEADDDAADDEATAEDETADDADDSGESDASDASDEEDEPDGDGPVFEVSDHRAGIVARRAGITLRMDGEEAQFGWDEIGAVEVDTPRFKKRFSVTVYATNRRWYEAEVQPSSRGLLKTWTDELDAVLDAYFDDAGPKDAGPEKEKQTAADDDDA